MKTKTDQIMMLKRANQEEQMRIRILKHEIVKPGSYIV